MKLSTRSPNIPIEPNSKRDFLDDVLSSLLVADSAVVFFEFTAPWAIKIEYEVPISCTVVEGELWLSDQNRVTQCFRAGDTFVLPKGMRGKPYYISSSEEFPQSWITANELFDKGQHIPFNLSDPQHISWGGGGSVVRIFSFAFHWFDQCYGPLIDTLPELMRINVEDAGTTLQNLMVSFLFKEAHPEQSGFGSIVAQTAQLFLIHAIRTFAVTYGSDREGWLKGFSDPRIAKALTCIHRDPGNKWSVETLGKATGMSRSVFSKRFTEVMGESPMDYVCAWRMHLARLALETTDTTVTALAQQLGYQSEAAFRTAFRKMTGQSPKEYSKSNASNLP
ncbi:helix-turn-helix domain-containing protein [Marinomonas mediterranea]|uniref:AraC family transcriptional regulator n=1 Tax=Marinomonas mediterranea TaxID=119864 RepID=UPI00234BF961|nr:AraC family transcriptional regulator [Marinomonas mediterranea]WCN13485.1 helix-turn-helix domain-containing protein [Marinomonas mediterranea]